MTGPTLDPVTATTFRIMRDLRQQRGWTCSELSTRLARAGLRMDRSVIAKCEANLRERLSIAEAVALAEVFEVSLATLLGLDEPCPHCSGYPPEGFACLTCGAGQPSEDDGGGKHRRWYRITDEHLAEVAEVYTSADSKGRSPTRAVADHFHASHSTAARWVGLARQRGKLAPA